MPPALVTSGSHNKILQTGWLKQHFISHSSGGWKLKNEVSAGLVSPEASLHGLHSHLLVYLQLAFPHLFCGAWSLHYYEDTSQITIELTLTALILP